MVDWLTKKLSVSVSKRVINKNEGGNASDLTDSFEPDQLTADELATSIAGGFAYCVQLKGKRSSATSSAPISHQLISTARSHRKTRGTMTWFRRVQQSFTRHAAIRPLSLVSG
jgi:hypothetical protein